MEWDDGDDAANDTVRASEEDLVIDVDVDDAWSAGGGMRALAPRGGAAAETWRAEAASGDGAPLLIAGTGVSMGEPFIRRRPRPLAMRLAMLTLASCVALTGLFAVTPLVGNGGDFTSFQALAGALVVQRAVSYHWYRAQAGDSVESIAGRFHVQIGGIYELNAMQFGDEIAIGQSYKIPDDPFYGRDYRPQVLLTYGGDGTTTFGSDFWNSYAGNPLPGARCAPYGGTPLGYHLVSPNPNSVWKRGWLGVNGWIHDGLDLAGPEGNPIHAAQDGQVIWAGWSPGGYAWSIKINHCHGLSTLYGHMAQLLVKAGDNVRAGEEIGLEGSTGTSTGPHLHFSVFVNNQYVDPMPYFGGSQWAATHA
jgi:murein DD-endopeptidase MepM/ murein hydrolase activator NlpD